jgi:3-hydroxyisobutyrate dehydrogenase-like beta-hydroxyacid dehydrogenase
MNRIGWIGLGSMGRPMAANLLKAGYEVYVYNRTREKADELLAQGARWAVSPKELAEICDVVITMVSGASAVDRMLNGETGVLAGLSAGKMVIDMSTISPDDSRRFAKQVADRGGQFLDAPVSGSIKPATDGTLLILAGGKKDTYESCRPLFDVLGKNSIHFGESGMGTSAKLVINLLLGMTMEAISESLLLAEKTGLQREQILQMFSESGVNTPLLQMKKQNLLNEQFPAAFALNLMLKDLGLALETADRTSAPLPAAAVVHTVFNAAKETGKGELDFSAVFLHLMEMAGNQ